MDSNDSKGEIAERSLESNHVTRSLKRAPPLSISCGRGKFVNRISRIRAASPRVHLRRRTQGCGTSASTGFRHRGKHVPRRAGRSQRQITAKESDESSDSFLATSGDKAAPFLAIELAIENLQRHKNCTGDAQRDDRIEIREMISDSGDFTK